MSGRKITYTSISEEELRNLRNRAAQATSLQESNRILNQLSERNEASLNEYRSRINIMNNNINNLNNRLAEQSTAANKEVQNLRTQLQRTVRENNIRIQELSTKNEEIVRGLHQNFISELRNTKSQLKDDIQTNNQRIKLAIQQNNERLKKEINEIERSMNSEFQNVHNELDRIYDSIKENNNNYETLLNMAREYQNASQILFEDINMNYRVELLCPGKLKRVLDLINSSKREIEDASNMCQNSAVARRDSRTSFEGIYRLYQDVVSAEQEWQVRFEATREVIDAIKAQLEASRMIKSDDDVPDVDVNHWTNGELSEISSRVEELDGQLKEPNELTFSQLDEIQSQGIQIGHDIDNCSMFALEAFYSSQDRGEIAQDIANQLNEMGISVIGHSYEGCDQRAAHRLHLRNNVTGFEIVITQTPSIDENGFIKNKLESDIINYGSLNSEHGDEIARDILSSISGLGLQQTNVDTVDGFDNIVSNRVEVTNMQQWTNQKLPQVIKPNH